MDYIYQSVDDDQDGQPDATPIITLFNKTPISSVVINQPLPKSVPPHQEEAKCMLTQKDLASPPVLKQVPSSSADPAEEMTTATDLAPALDEPIRNINISQVDVAEEKLPANTVSDNNVLTRTTFSTPELEKAIQQINEALPL